MENENEAVVPETTEEEVVEEVVDETQESETADETEARIEEERQARIKAEELAQNYKARAEKAEKKAKEVPKVVVKQEPQLTSRDTIALINAKIHEEDVDEVIDYAKFKGISIAEALKSGVIKSSLKEREEMRTTANAANTGKTRTGSFKVSGNTLLEKAQKTGEIPERDEDIQALVEARYEKK